MNYQTEIDKYRAMYDATPVGKWMTKRLIAHKIDALMQERSRMEGRTTIERFIPEFSYAYGEKPKFNPKPEAPIFLSDPTGFGSDIRVKQRCQEIQRTDD